jgi:sigma-B regulation protein RsbU (phosphoserine phosphatase)
VWDDQKRALLVANSGLPRPIHYHDGKVDFIEATGLPLGLFDVVDYDEFSFKAKPGDVFVFYSDGILDARNRHGHSFGPDRVADIVAGCSEKSAECVVKEIFKSVNAYAAGVDPFDDQTVLAIKVKSAPGKSK